MRWIYESPQPMFCLLLFVSQYWPDVSANTKISFCFTRHWRRSFHLPAQLNLQSKREVWEREEQKSTNVSGPFTDKKLGINPNFSVQPEFNHKWSWCCPVIGASLLAKIWLFKKYTVQNRSHIQTHSQNSSGLLLE